MAHPARPVFRTGERPALSVVPVSKWTPISATPDPLLVCLDCGDDYLWSDSPDDDRCPWCAGIRAWHLDGAA